QASPTRNWGLLATSCARDSRGHTMAQMATTIHGSVLIGLSRGVGHEGYQTTLGYAKPIERRSGSKFRCLVVTTQRYGGTCADRTSGEVGLVAPQSTMTGP